MFLQDVTKDEVVEFAKLLEVFARPSSKVLHLTRYEPTDHKIIAHLVDEFGNVCSLVLTQETTFIDGQITNESIMWPAYLNHKFRNSYLSWLRDKKIQGIEMEFFCKVAGRPNSVAYSVASVLRRQKIAILNTELSQLELLSQHLYESCVDESISLERKAKKIDDEEF